MPPSFAANPAIADVLAAGTRTRDIAPKGTNAVSATEMGEAVLKAFQKRLG